MSQPHLQTEKPANVTKGGGWRVAGGGYFLAHLILGCLLLATATLKGHQLFTAAPVRERYIWDARWFQIFLIEIETVLAVWLLSGIRPEAARRVAMLSFACFALVNAIMAWNGEASCGCFGRVHMRPVDVLVFDVVCVVVLALCRARPATARHDELPEAKPFNPLAIVGLAVLACGILVRGWVRPPDEMFSRVALEPGITDLGTMPQGEKLTRRLTFTNGLPVPIQIVGIRSSCNCTTAGDWTGRTVAADSRVELPITYDAGEHDGPRTSHFTVYYRDIGRQLSAWQTVSFSANVATDYRVEPREVDFGTLDADRTATRSVVVRPVQLRDVTVTRVECEMRSVNGRIAADGGNIRVDLTYQPEPSSPGGRVGGRVRLHTNSTHLPVADVFVSAEVTPIIDIEPRMIVVGAEAAGTVEHAIAVRWRGRPSRIKQVSSAGGNLQCRTVEDSEGSRVAVAVPPCPDGRCIDSEVRMVIEGGGGERLVVVPVHRFPNTKEASK